MRCEGKIVLVTGAQRGIGRAVALRFAQEGADVALNYLDDAQAADSAAAQIVALGRRAFPSPPTSRSLTMRAASWRRSSAISGRSTCW